MKGHTGDLIAMISHRTGARIVGTAGKHKYTATGCGVLYCPSCQHGDVKLGGLR